MTSIGTRAALQPTMNIHVNTPFPSDPPNQAKQPGNLPVDHDCGKFFRVLFDSPSGVANCVGMNRYDVFPVPNFAMLVRRLVQAALVGAP